MPKTTPTRAVTPVITANARTSNVPDEPIGAGKQLLSAVGDQDAERAAHAGEQQAFCQQLPDQPRPRRTHRQAHGQLALAERGARQEQIGDVRAYQQQHQRRDDGDDLERANIIGVRVVNAMAAAFGNQCRHVEMAAMFGGIPLTLRETGEICIHAGFGLITKAAGEIAVHLLNGNSRFQAPHNLHPPVCRAVQAIFAAYSRVECDRQDDIARFCERALCPIEAGRCDSDNGERHIGNRDDAPEDVRIGGEARAPIPLAQHHHRWCRGAVIARLDGAAGPRGDAEHREVVSGYQQTADRFSASVHDCSHQPDRDRSRQVDHGLVGFAEMQVHRI